MVDNRETEPLQKFSLQIIYFLHLIKYVLCLFGSLTFWITFNWRKNSSFRSSMKLLNSDTAVGINLIVEVRLDSITVVKKLMLTYLSFDGYCCCLIARFDNKSSIWSCRPWWALSFTITWSLLLPCSGDQSTNIFLFSFQDYNLALWSVSL